MKRAILALLAVGAGGAITTLVLLARDPERTAAAMCAAWWLGLTLAIGALGAIMTLDLSHATWFVFFRPIARSIAATTTVLALGLVPAALVAHRVYPWAGAEHDIPAAVLARIERTRPWMSPWPVYARTLLSLGAWSTLAIWLHTSAKGGRARVTSAVGLPVLAITATITPFDWMMRVEPGWTSSIYGMYVGVSGFYGALALVAVLSFVARARGALDPEARADHFHALGRLMLAAVCLWAYLAFFQLLLQWIGNLPAEAVFWTRRTAGSWAIVSVVLIVGHFLVPFFLLLSRPLKRSPSALAAVGALMLAMHVLDVAWLVLPSRTPGLQVGALAPACAVLGLAAAYGLWRFSVTSRTTRGATPDPEFIRAARYQSP
jgi:hypothetical protein